MSKLKPRFAVATAGAALLLVGGLLYGGITRISVVSSGAANNLESGVIQNVGQSVIGRSTDGSVVAHMGIVPILAHGLRDPVPGDCTDNGLVDLDDHDVFVRCMDGPGVGVTQDCDCVDMDGDGDVDNVDAARFARRFDPGT